MPSYAARYEGSGAPSGSVRQKLQGVEGAFVQKITPDHRFVVIVIDAARDDTREEIQRALGPGWEVTVRDSPVRGSIQ